MSLARRLTATALAVSVAGLSSAGPLLAQSPTSLSGRVLAANGSEARSGVVVALVDTSAEKIFRSQPTDARGAFRVDAPNAGRYALVVEAPEGAFLASDGLVLAPGQNRPVALALKPGKQGTEPAPTPAPTSASTGGGLPNWAKWVIAGGIVVGAAIVVDAVTSDDEASAF
ncbi:MAG TPA: carboxypeptidase-like regulatory domain-containing protein [Candidatus Polarisedimenticolaceae bacterium]|nr:carboxypeptidase-like regulatory domain-containing protein [Candidatus Polarisedimenticolaceae bacterium]